MANVGFLSVEPVGGATGAVAQQHRRKLMANESKYRFMS
jgi:putative aminopeptidase FrvX